MSKRLALPLLALLGASLIAAGCGSSDETTTTTTTDATATGTETTVAVPPEREALIADADAICAAGDAEIEAAQGQLPVDASPELQQEFVLETLVPNIQGQLDQLAELQPSEADVAEFRGIITDAQAALDRLAEDPSLVTTEGVESPFADVNARAQAFGLQACGS